MGRYLDMVRRRDQPRQEDDASDLLPINEGSPNWLAEWRELASQTAGLLPDDPRLSPVLEGLSRCDEAFLANDYPGFLRAKAAVLCLMKEVPHE
ncbi:hypothetical protein [Nitrospira sp. BLG_2]|uniref:hypothetical protein n=1 Tax=Nitrospira sp. BLG_2 TaxID=3397507 RepID=UPI003B9B4E33